ncbi:hypothetical protein QOZ80_2BG0154070 [Eleusine coracana subsp. coracana]|nr:hypothetical protein QOZ80_2BG0154070 [Eleusine coracana subsp. coracana]
MGDGAGERSWYLSREEIECGSPSRRDGIGAAREAELRATYCSFIRDVCFRLQLPQITFATAILLCHRFYLRQSLARNEWQTMATVCIFLASKIEETPCQLRHVVIVAYETMYRKKPDAAKRICQDEVLEKQKALILVGETLLLSTIGFDFNIQHPYEPLKVALKNLGITHKEVKQAAVNFINDMLPTTLALQFKPHYIAAGSLFLAAKFHNFRLSETGKIWWQEFEVAPKQLQVVLQQMTELFKKRDPCSMGPAIKPALIQTPMDKKQMIITPSPDIKPPPTPALMDRQQITSTQGLAPKHAQSSSRRTSKSDAVASRCLHVDSSSCNKSICSSARDEQNQPLQVHINHRLNIVAVDERSEKQSSWGTLKADHVYHVSTGPKDMRTTSIKDLTRQKRRIQESGRYPASDDISDQGVWTGRQLKSIIVIETNSSWKRQKVERE